MEPNLQILHPNDLHLNSNVNRSEEESVELARFRAEWKAEVERRRRLGDGEPSSGFAALARAHPELASERQVEQKVAFTRPVTRVTAGIQASASTSTGPKTSHPAIKNGAIALTAISPSLNSALAIYRKAVQYEQNGDLDAALTSYRQAFRLDPNVDRAFQREESLQAKVQSYADKVPRLATLPATSSADIDDLTSELQLSVKRRQSSSPLAQIIASFPSDLTFEPEDERQPVILNNLPTEIIYMVIRKMSVAMVERFARVSRKARMLTLDPVYWSELVRTTYKPPQLLGLDDIVEKYYMNFRQLFIEQPRVRTDGLYIAICHYTRPGLSENSWANVSHLVTYHRYLRFFSNGQVLSLLTNEEMGPQQVVPIIKPTLRMKGFYIGNWYLTESTLNIVNLMDASGKYLVPEHDLTTFAPDFSSIGVSRASPPTDMDTSVGERLLAAATFSASTSSLPQDHTHNHSAHGHGGHHGHGQGHGNVHGGSSNAPPVQIRYVFDMSLNLRSKPLGRWNRLDLATYDSVNLETGEVYPVPLKHERPFWFSKVRSYN